MTTIAQQVIDMCFLEQLPVQDAEVLAAYEFAAHALTATVPLEQFHFEAAVVESALNLTRAEDTQSAVYDLAHLPCSPVWFEWVEPSEGSRYAAMLKYDEEQKVRFLLFLGSSLGPLPIAVGDMTFTPDDSPRYKWIKAVQVKEPSSGFILAHMVTVMAMCAFLALPKVVDASPVEWPTKLQKARKKRGKAPLLSYRRVTLQLPKAGRNATAHGGDGSFTGKRRHQVIGHLRINKHVEAAPSYVWVSPHWRGDASLGLVLKNRNVVMGS